MQFQSLRSTSGLMAAFVLGVFSGQDCVLVVDTVSCFFEGRMVSFNLKFLQWMQLKPVFSVY